MPKTTKRAVKKVNKKMTDKEFYEKLDALYYEPDSEATVEQVKSWVKFENINDEILLTRNGHLIMENITIGAKNEAVSLRANNSTNYWKYACITILLGIVVSMIIFTPTITSMFDACKL